MAVKKNILNNGLTIVTEKRPSTSCSIGFWVEVGSVNESENESGYAHFVEHMLFKGTKKRTAKDIANEIDRVGAYLNASTTKEYTDYFINIQKDKIDLALDILIDIIENSTFPKNELKMEKLVVLEEIKTYEDSPDELVHDNLYEAMFPEHPLGKPILGDKSNVKAMTRDKIVKFYRKYYKPNNIIIAAAGNVDHNHIVEYVKKKKFLYSSDKLLSKNSTKIDVKPKNYIISKKLEQIHICLGFPGLSAVDSDRYSLYIFNTIFGSSMSSRLFQEIREKSGLCYSIYSFYTSFKDSGIFGIYTGTGLNRFEKSFVKIIDEIKKIKKYGITKNELSDAKEHIKGHLALAYENNEVRMNRLARQEMVFHKYFTYNNIAKMVDKVTQDSVMNIIYKIFPKDYKIIISSIGDEKHKTILQQLPTTI